MITESFNWNKSAAELNFENLIFIKSKKLADAYSQVFNKLPAEVFLRRQTETFLRGSARPV